MAEEMKNHDQAAGVESTDRGMFDFLGKKKEDEKKPSDQEEVMSSQFEQKVHVSEPTPSKEADHDEEDVKKGSLLDKLHRSSSSSSSSSEEEVEEGGEKRKKKKDKKKKEKKEEEDTTVPVEKCDDGVVLVPEEKKGFMDKIKEKLPGHGKKEEVVAGEAAGGHPVPTSHPPHQAAAESASEKQEDKKGFLEKIKEKLPGYHPKTTTEEEKEKDKETH
ncbi:Phosphoprotein ECPP44 [Linum grandiflorum]